jgi:prepilin-type N-terminal cleavage/methylation domain-containing protein
MPQQRLRSAFSLVELIVVVVIIGILAAIAIPRFSRGAEGAGDAGVRGNLTVLRNAIELYYYEHGKYPGQVTDGTNAAGSEAAMIAQLTMYTSDAGVTSATKSTTYRFGPYLRTGVPPCPVAPRAGLNGVNMVNGATTPAYTASATTAGWVYNYETGEICVNSNATGTDGVSFDQY